MTNVDDNIIECFSCNSEHKIDNVCPFAIYACEDCYKYINNIKTKKVTICEIKIALNNTKIKNKIEIFSQLF